MRKTLMLAAGFMLIAGTALAQSEERPQQYYKAPQTPPPTQQQGYTSPGYPQGQDPNQAQAPSRQPYPNQQYQQNSPYPNGSMAPQERDPMDPQMNPHDVRNPHR